MNQNNELNRRSFMKMVFGFVSLFGLGISASPKLLDEQNSIAKSMKFVQDATKSKDRKDPKAVCANCVLYKKQTTIDGSEAGVCSMLPGGLVKSGGWCASWVKNKKVYQ